MDLRYVKHLCRRAKLFTSCLLKVLFGHLTLFAALVKTIKKQDVEERVRNPATLLLISVIKNVKQGKERRGNFVKYLVTEV